MFHLKLISNVQNVHWQQRSTGLVFYRSQPFNNRKYGLFRTNNSLQYHGKILKGEFEAM